MTFHSEFFEAVFLKIGWLLAWFIDFYGTCGCWSILWVILNKSWRQYPTKQQLYCHLPPITKTIHIGQTRHAGHCWRSRDELICDILLWTPSHGWAKAGRPARTYIQQLCADTGCSLENLPEAVDDRDGWRERVRHIRADSVIWWWWMACQPVKCYFCVQFRDLRTFLV